MSTPLYPVRCIDEQVAVRFGEVMGRLDDVVNLLWCREAAALTDMLAEVGYLAAARRIAAQHRTATGCTCPIPADDSAAQLAQYARDLDRDLDELDDQET